MICFYDPKDPYGFFSNFSRHNVFVYGVTWRTSEHPFQAMKFHPHRPDLIKLVYAATSPGAAARLGRDRSFPLHSGWDAAPVEINIEGDLSKFQFSDGLSRPGVQPEPIFARWKDVVMYTVVYAKFTQHRDLREVLLGTGDETIVEDAVHDPYWGRGSSHVGENKLGRILMAVRYAIAHNTGKPGNVVVQAR